MIYNVYRYEKSIAIDKETLKEGLETGSYEQLSFDTEEEVLSFVRSELYDIYKYYDKDPHANIWTDKFDIVNCYIRYIDVWGFSAILIRIERINAKSEEA